MRSTRLACHEPSDDSNTDNDDSLDATGVSSVARKIISASLVSSAILAFGLFWASLEPSIKVSQENAAQPTSAIIGLDVVQTSKAETDQSTPAMAKNKAGTDKSNSEVPQFCSDGNLFSFSVDLSVDEVPPKGRRDILVSSRSAFEFAMEEDVVHFGFHTFNFGVVNVSGKVGLGSTNEITIRKTDNSICLSACKRNACDRVEPNCTFAPWFMPVTSFQMVEAGEISWGSNLPVKSTGFKQTIGFTPITFALEGISFSQLWDSNGDWDSLTAHMQEMLAALSGDGMMPSNVQVFPLMATSDGEGTVFQASVMPAGESAGSPCAVHKKLRCSLQGKTLKNTIFNAAAKAYVKAAGFGSTGSGQIALTQVELPSRRIACGSFGCRKSNARALPEEASCLGGGCNFTCCDMPWSDLDNPLPYKLPKIKHNLQGVTDKELDCPHSDGTFTMPDFTKPITHAQKQTTTTTTNLFQNIFSKPGSLKDKFSKLIKQTGSTVPSKDLGTEFNTDGYTFNFEVVAALGKGACSERNSILTADGDAMEIETIPEKVNSTKCYIRFSALLLNPVMGDTTGGCVARSTFPLHEEVTYELKVSRDYEKCCIQVAPAKGFAGVLSKWFQEKDAFLAAPGCGFRSPSVPQSSFIMRPIRRVYKEDSASVKTESFSQTQGGLTMSFKIQAVSYKLLTNDCKCKDNFVKTMQEAIAYQSGLKSYDDVEVVIKQDWMADDPNLDQKAPPAKPSSSKVSVALPTGSEQEKAEKNHNAKLKRLLSGGYWTGVDATQEDVAAATQMAMAGPAAVDAHIAQTNSNTDTVQGYSPRRLQLWKKVARAFRVPEPIKGFWSAISVQVSVGNCGSCGSAKTALEDPATDAAILDRITMITGDGPGGAASTGPIKLVDKSIPATPMTCWRYQCSNPYTANDFPWKTCSGAACEATCCQPRTCMQVQCKAPLINSPFSAIKTCSNEAECGNKCCVLPCPAFRCPGGSCPRENSWMVSAKPSEASEACCRHTDCCNAPIAACVSCLKCESKQSYCSAGKPKGKHRRLHDGNSTFQDVVSSSFDEKTFLEGEVAAFPSKQPDEEHYSHEDPSIFRSTFDSMAPETEIDQTTLRGGARSLKSEAKDLVRRLQKSERSGLLAGMSNQVLKATTFRLANLPPANINGYSRGAPLAASWSKDWKTAVLDAKARHNGMIAGCESVNVKMCPYYFKSIFLLHRGCEKDPLAVNAVQVLTDTRHAVSCGNDGLCWVWDIATAKPVQVYFPEESCKGETRKPILSVSVLHDASYVMSAGMDGAHIWDWKYGHSKISTKCGGNDVYLSTAEMPAWRMVLLGCNNSYTTVWNWDANNKLLLPYNARTTEQILGYFQRIFVLYKNNGLEGMQRMFLEKAMMTEKMFLDALNVLMPGITQGAEMMSQIHNFFHKNTFGAVNGVAYIPVRLSFVTGHQDGKVRYWDAQSGTLLMVMRGHQGPVTSVAPSPKDVEAVSGGEDGTVRLWCLKTGVQKLLLYQPYGGPVLSLAIIPGGTKVVVGSADGYVRIWDLSNGLLLCAINTGGGAVKGLAVNPSNPLGQILTANADGYVRVFNPR